MVKKILLFASISGAVAVALGALGAHFLKEHLSDKMMNAFETGVRYQMYHSLALIGLALVHEKMEERSLRRAGRLFMAGIILFSGSLYAMVFAQLGGMSWDWLGPITPLGGVCFILGWLMFAFTFLL
ncbi:MAG TPA: DUF423 domain-containing protein [Bacteroidia bacterium]|jgi:uncharacterized membrane protein YgdD (TMEM256/DUF423 family)